MRLLEELFPRARAEVLRLLFAESGRALHLRELARLSGLAVGTLQGELGRLRRLGLLVERRDGNRLYFSAHEGHPVFAELRGLVLKTSGLRGQLVEALSGLGGVTLALVYGSCAEGTPGPDSDVDLLVVGTVGLRELSPRLRGVSEALGREVNAHVLAPESFTLKWREGDVYINSVTAGARLWIVGGEDELARLA